MVSVGRADLDSASLGLKGRTLPLELTTRVVDVVGRPGYDPGTFGLRIRCSDPVELAAQVGFLAAQKPHPLESRSLLEGWLKKAAAQKPHLMLAPDCYRGDRPDSNRRRRIHSPSL